MLPCHMPLWATSRHASAPAIAFRAIGRAVSAETGAVLLGTGNVVVAVLTEHLAAAIVGSVLLSAIAADQAMISVVAAVGQLLAGVLILVQSTVRTVILIWVIGAVRAIVRVFARLIVTVGVKGAVVAVPGMILRPDRAAVGSHICMLHAAVTTDQTVISVVAAIGQLLSGVLILVPSAVRAEIPVRVIGAVGTIVRVFARLEVAIGVKGAVVAIPGMIL